MSETRLKELLNEIARLEKIDNATTKRITEELDAMECDELQIPCSKDLSTKKIKI